jgi:hypothetical protein
MNAKSKFLHDPEVWHKLATIEIQPVKCLVSAGVVVVLVVAWVLTGPLFQWRDQLVSRSREQRKTQM